MQKRNIAFWVSLGSMVAVSCALDHEVAIEVEEDTGPTKYDAYEQANPPEYAQAKPYCMPQAVEAIRRVHIRDVISGWEAEGDCQISKQTQTSLDSGSHTTTYHEFGDLVSVFRDQKKIAEYAVDPDGWVLRNISYDPNGQDFLGSELVRDASGRLVEERSWGVVTRQVFDGDRLVKVSRTPNESVDQTFVHTFSYDAQGRLTEATAEWSIYQGSSRTRRNVWAYTAEGLPAKLDTYLDGQHVYATVWHWNQAGELVSRTSERFGAPLWIGCYEPHLMPLDQYENELVRHCGPPAEYPESDCKRLPVAPAWDHPESDYRLSVAPELKTLDYASGLSFGVAAGAARHEPPNYYGYDPQGPNRSTVQTEYQSGVMVRELRTEPATAELPAWRSERNRVLMPDGLAQDVYTVFEGPVDRLGTSSIAWTRDSGGQITELLRRDPSGIIERASFTWDQDRLLQQRLEQKESGALKVLRDESRTYDASERLVLRTMDTSSQHIKQSVDYSYTDGVRTGTLLETDTEFQAFDGPRRSTRLEFFDAEGRDLARQVDDDNDGTWDRLERWERDVHGNVLNYDVQYETTLYNGGTKSYRSSYQNTYVCR